jgi:choline dehydrogenase
MSIANSYDYVVVGGGTAGCVITTRLVEAGFSVLLLEAGPTDKDIFIHMPAGMRNAQRHAFNYDGEALPGSDVPPIHTHQGRVLGGSGSINGMVYVRGSAHDYDDWEHLYGCAGWSHEDVLPYFRRSEGNEVVSGPMHGTEGYMPVTEHRYRHPLAMAFIKAGQEIGFPYLTDMSGATGQPGVGFWQCTISGGKRVSAARAFLQRVMDNPLLTLVTDATAQKVNIESGVARGVRYTVKNDAEIDAIAKREVIVTAGTIETPKVLMLSGVGPAQHLAEFGIRVVADNAHVGQNFQDHLMMSITAETPGVRSFLHEGKGLTKIRNGLEWLTFNKYGVVSSNVLESGGYFDINGDGRLDSQMFVFPFYEAKREGNSSPNQITDGMAIKVGHQYPDSRGQVLLSGPKASDRTRLIGGYLSAEGDLEMQIRAFKLGLKFFEAPSLKKIAKNVSPQLTDDLEIATFIKKNCTTNFHPTSSCRMGNSPETSAVDLSLRVWGVKNLRVADASVMPHIVAGNTNAPTMMIAERAAEMIIAAEK